MTSFSSTFRAFSVLAGVALLGCAGDKKSGDADSDSDVDSDSDTPSDSETGSGTGSGLEDAGPDGGDAGIPDGYDCGGDDVLEVNIVELARFDPDTDLPVAGATLVVDCEDGRIEVTADENGVARAYRLDFVNDPVDVTIYAAGYTTRTLYDVGGKRTVPSPLRIPLGSRANVAYTRFDGDLVRTQTPGGALTSVRGGGYVASEDDATYEAALADDYPNEGRLTSIEWTQDGDGTATLTSFVEDVLDPAAAPDAPTLDFPAAYANVQRFDVTVSYDLLEGSPLESRLALDDDDPDPTRAFYGGVVIDQEDSTLARNVLGITESVDLVGLDETYHVAYADEMLGTPILVLLVASSDRKVYATFRSNTVPPDAGTTFVVEDPPSTNDVDPGVAYDYPETTVILTEGRWANVRTVSFVSLGSEEAYGGTAPFWNLQVPPDRIGWKLPDPPTGVEWGDLLPGFGQFAIIISGSEYDVDPLASYELLTDRYFARDHFVRSVSDGRYRGQLVEP